MEYCFTRRDGMGPYYIYPISNYTPSISQKHYYRSAWIFSLPGQHNYRSSRGLEFSMEYTRSSYYILPTIINHLRSEAYEHNDLATTKSISTSSKVLVDLLRGLSW